MSDRRSSAGRLIRAGLVDLDKAARLLDTGVLTDLMAALSQDDDLLTEIGQAADPDMALLLLVRWLESCDERQRRRIIKSQ